MTLEANISSYRLEGRRIGLPAAEAIRAGVLAGLCGVFFALIGAYVTMNERFVVDGWLTLSQAVLFALGLTSSVVPALAGATPRKLSLLLSCGLLAGLSFGLVMAGFLLLIHSVDLRTYLVASGLPLVRALSFVGDAGSFYAASVLVLAGATMGTLGGFIAIPGARLRNAIICGLISAIVAGLFRDVFADILNNIHLRSVQLAVFGAGGVNAWAACAIAAVTALCRYLTSGHPKIRRDALSRRRTGLALLIIAMIVAPLITSSFVGQALVLVALYTLMGMGLHIELGLAGLLDLGFVAFYAVGAYTVALLCSTSPLAIAHISFWLALPIAVILAALSGFIFGLPVLRVRGDYLALATIGLGEIIRLLVLSDLTAPLLGGSQGIISVARPVIAENEMSSPTSFYYLALGLAGLAAFISTRLQASKVGRAWLAIREDEDVAQSLGIDLVAVKLRAYTIGAGFAGASGAVFAVMIGAVYPHSFQLLTSVNLLSLLVIGGLGSLPGVVVGSLVLIGMPELLREFGEFRYLFYGIALIAMVRYRPEGLWPAIHGRTGRG